MVVVCSEIVVAKIIKKRVDNDPIPSNSSSVMDTERSLGPGDGRRRGLNDVEDRCCRPPRIMGGDGAASRKETSKVASRGEGGVVG